MKAYAIYLLLPVILSVGLASIHFLPAPGEMAKSAISMELPNSFGTWQAKHIPASPIEREILAPDTRFSKANCFRPRVGEYNLSTGNNIFDRIDLSVVLSGHDLNNSIHRPERCMPSQGHVISSSTNQSIGTFRGKELVAKRLLSVQSIPLNEEKTEYLNFDCVTYYFFVGSHRTTEDHLQRTLLDMKDRLLLGVDQHWAYVSVSMWYGELPWIENKISIDEADTKIKEFISMFAEEQINWDMIDS